MNRPSLIATALSTACALCLGLAGCATESSATTGATASSAEQTGGHAPVGAGGHQNPQPGTPMAAAPAAPAARSMNWPFNASTKSMNWTNMAIPTGNANTSALGIEKGTPTEVRLNQPFDYMIVVTNLTNQSLDGVVVTDVLGPNFQVSKSVPEGQADKNGLMTWNIGDMGPNETKTIKVTGTATKEGTVGSCATATYARVLCSSIPVVSPKLMLTKTGPAEAIKCDEITYKLEVANTGTGAVTGVKINDPLPAGMTTADGKKAVEFAIGTLAAGEKRAVTTTVRADKAGKFENKATASGDGGLAAESAVVTTMLREPMLTITKNCPGTLFIGRAMEYEITVTNKGDGVSVGTTLEDPLPAGTTFASATEGGKLVGGKIVWSLGDMAPKAIKMVRYSLTSPAAGSFASTATVRGACAAPATATCTTQVTGIPAILLEVVDVNDPVQVGSNLTYVITVTNQGSAPGTNIKLVCNLEANQTFVSTSGPTNGTASGGTITFAPLSTLAPKAVAVYRVVVKNVKAGDVRFKTSMTSDQLGRPVEETEATNVYE